VTETGTTGWKAVVVADESGQILGGFVKGLGGGDNPPALAIAPTEGQFVQEVELPGELIRDDGLDLGALFDHRLVPGSQPGLRARGEPG
jgi:hypothetical protein